MISYQVIKVMNKTNWSDDEKQAFYVAMLEEGLEFHGTDKQVRKQINKYMMYRRQNDNWVENNRRRLVQENMQTIRDLYSQYDKYVESPDRTVEAEEVIEEFVEGLSDTNQRTFERIYLDGLTPDELADEEGVSRNAIDQRVHNIKQQLKEKYNDAEV